MAIRRLRCRYPFERWDCTVCGRQQDRPPWSYIAGMACELCLDRGMRGEPFIPLTVRAVAPKTERDYRPVYAVCVRDQIVLTEAGEVIRLDQLPDRIREREPGEHGAGSDPLDQLPAGLVVTDAGVELIAYLDAQPELADSDFWNWSLGLKEQSAWRPEAGGVGRTFAEPKPVRFGFASRRGDKRRAHGGARWYQLLDVHTFVELPDGWGEPDARELLTFGLDLRAWANDNELPVLASASAYGGRLLRDARFGGGWRRKIPAATNASVRPLLCGNHYQQLGERAVYREVHKLDQHAAHHHAALTIEFPDSHELNARGFFRQPGPPNGAPMARRGAIRAGSREWRELLTHHGVFIAAVKVPELVAIDPLQLPQLRKAGTIWRTFTSVELPELERLHDAGVRLLDIWSAWTSPDTDDRLREYAFWSSERLQASTPAQRRWLKPLLLAAYGMLAVRPSRFRSAWRWCHRQDAAVGYQTRYGHLIGWELAGDRERESMTANVVWRALIESKVRLETIRHARELREQRFRPISLYADAIFTLGDTIPPTPIPWRYEGVVHNLEFESPSRYRALEEVRLPGTPRRGRSAESQLPEPTERGLAA